MGGGKHGVHVTLKQNVPGGKQAPPVATSQGERMQVCEIITCRIVKAGISRLDLILCAQCNH